VTAFPVSDCFSALTLLDAGQEEHLAYTAMRVYFFTFYSALLANIRVHNTGKGQIS